MTVQNPWKLRLTGIGLTAFGILFGGTLRRFRFCFGDSIFSAMGLSPWSNGETGLHYPGIIGMVMILIGATFINYTIKGKKRFLLWCAVIAVMIAAGALSAYI